MIYEARYHIYVNDKCVRNNRPEEEFKREMQHIQAFLELTHLDKSATLDYVRCEPPALTLVEGSY